MMKSVIILVILLMISCPAF
ncbi:type I toxin-antitoxin system Ibs family toxin [Escherichia albertii]|nr:type I toxin-antitoxin system Ibs family toxin [Escherichia albertii]EFO0997743.1 type I toxin-antitoxin system Ibs family toxin [Escherichia albertii]EJI9010499.1 type I toxin-antitoxin system Ibs family toxin [Escherichia albertii]EJM9604972.1 type I toxin-antitoxin system Ibs family toxin [Escherichia albertii]EJQ6145792.1 type I toxin-antitoxin system Ibs family toxin [Escherichia albertii]